jgi:predicted O-methyltransferase YrrM
MLSKALNTEGWTTQQELSWLNTTAARLEVVELGCYMGRSTLALAEHAKFVLAIDDWRMCDYTKFHDNVDGYIDKVVFPVHMDHSKIDLDKLPKRPPFDMVFIDGDHAYASVVRDIQLWRKHIRPGGIICGHDYANPEWPDVKRVVDEIFPSVSAVGFIWWVTL